MDTELGFPPISGATWPVRVLPGPGAGTLMVVSSVWMTDKVITKRPINAATGVSHRAACPIQSAKVARSISIAFTRMPKRPYADSPTVNRLGGE